MDNISTNTASKQPVATESFWRKLARIIVTVSLPLIALGQWVDTRDLLVDSYNGFITHFTDKVELQQLNQVRVGANIDYLESFLGTPQLIKRSTTLAGQEFRYYHQNKYLLGLAVDGTRVSMYSVTALTPSLTVAIPFADDKSLLTQPLFQLEDFMGDFTLDTGNLTFFYEQLPLGKQGLFFKRQLGWVEYGAMPEQAAHSHQQITQQVTRLDKAYVLGDQQAMQAALTDLRRDTVPNTFAVGPYGIESAAEMLLTRYEYQAYFGDTGL
ncbi:hypothetical protein CWI84_06345 [Idiomarina tyrosinivorans]|uniref:Uncharacterized protein n=1 Tax=Idiomarina tyrosinivorans TaxID=1445662 RepID=A0A432ZQY5_9GAMM|nr:ETEC_3214 domain-containing protein [Idiomarina tyrosinivorans]RUO80248.1 hypothetical protein CWI84_06345 [Idiomarina tyrosinivorans]